MPQICGLDHAPQCGFELGLESEVTISEIGKLRMLLRCVLTRDSNSRYHPRVLCVSVCPDFEFRGDTGRRSTAGSRT